MASSQGTGGAVRSSSHRLKAISIGPFTVRNTISNFVFQHGRGAFSSRTEAGNLGFDVLSQFAVTIDYMNERLSLVPLRHPEKPIFNRSGIGASKTSSNAFTVTSILQHSPGSEAGIAVGDLITAVNGVPANRLSSDDLSAAVRAGVGTRLVLGLQHLGKVRQVRMKLREMLP